MNIKSEETVMIRIYKSDRDTYNRWCIKKGINMPELHKTMIKYGISQRYQSFYNSLPSPSKFNVPLRKGKSRIKRVCIQETSATYK